MIDVNTVESETEVLGCRPLYGRPMSRAKWSALLACVLIVASVLGRYLRQDDPTLEPPF